MAYRWTKVWAVNTSADDAVVEGDLIVVESSGGDSKQMVQSVTPMLNKSGKPYQTLLLQEVK
jgi:hypothetical protein